MQISTSQFYDRSASTMGKLTAQADTLQTQISTGKKLAAPSDDSVAYQRLRGLDQATADDAAASANLTLASGLLAQADSALDGIGEQLQRASELAVRANNGTLSDANRKVIGTELAAIADAMVGLANTLDTRGQPLFGDADGGAAVTKGVDGKYTLASKAPPAVPIGGGQQVQTSETAQRIFSFGDTNTLAAIAELAAALQSGEPLGDAGSTAIDDLASGLDQLSAVRASLGARATRVDVESARLRDVAVDREDVRSGMEDTDLTTAITELQKTMTVLSATQASFSKLSNLSLFDYLR